MGALLKNGDLIPDKNGVITKEQTLAAFMRVGISKKTAVESTDANFQSSICPNCPTSIDPFNMNTIKNGQNLPSPIGGAKEHFRSTGIRDGSSPNVGAWNFAESRCVGSDRVWKLGENKCISSTWDIDISMNGQIASNDIDAAKRPPTCTDPDDTGEEDCPSQLYGSINALFQEFANPTGPGGRLSTAEYTALWIEGEYPTGFAARSPRTCVEDISEPHFGCQRCLGLINEAQNFDSSQIAVERYCRCILSKDLQSRGVLAPESFSTLCAVAESMSASAGAGDMAEDGSSLGILSLKTRLSIPLSNIRTPPLTPVEMESGQKPSRVFITETTGSFLTGA